MKLIANRRADAAEADPLARFAAETTATAAPTVRPSRKVVVSRTHWMVLGIAAATAIAAVAGVGVWQRRASAAPALVTLTIETTPAGGEVFVGGVARGRAPVTLQVPAGFQGIEVANGADRIPVRLTAAPGSVVSQQVVFSQPPAAAATASLVVNTDPARLKVTVDDVPRGIAPATVSGLAPGPHRVRVTSADGVTDRSVDLAAGQTMSLFLTASRPTVGTAGTQAGTGGWLTIASAIPLQLLEGGQVIGTSAAARIMLPAGEHDIEVVNDDLGFRGRRKIRIAAGAVAGLRVDLPKAALSINAIPWADVTVDADHVGETPIGNYSVSIGRHEVIFRHPELGERRQTVVVGLKAPARVTMDLKSK